MIMTVTGPVEKSRLGVTMTHEHLIANFEGIWHEPAMGLERVPTDAPVRPENLWLLQRDGTSSRDNLRLDDVDMIAKELSGYRRLGGSTLVELTPRNTGRDPSSLRLLSRRTGVQIICGTGYYVERTHPARLSGMSVDRIADELADEITNGTGNTGIRPGLIGEIGTSAPIAPKEVKVLRASARAHLRTGVPINVHLSHPRDQGHRVLDILEEEGVEMKKVALSHLDQVLSKSSLDYHQSLAERGAFIEYDDFGEESHMYQWTTFRTLRTVELPRDTERVAALSQLIDRGCGGKILLSSDVCEKVHLTRYGGFGYQHILRDVVPIMREKGITSRQIRRMLVTNPADFLG